jgi:antagonist of KipI
MVFAVGGADFSPTLSGETIANWTSYAAKPGDILLFSGKGLGERAYLSVSGGFTTGNWLGSASTNLIARAGGHLGRSLIAGDELKVEVHAATPGLTVGRSLISRYKSSPVIRITTGPEFDNLTGMSASRLMSESFSISAESNRMGFRMSGPELFRLSPNEMVSSATTFGTVQLLPNGQIIILMADHQTTGGYPRIANVAAVDLPLLAQLGPGKTVKFDLIRHSVAERLLIDFERDLAFLRTGIQLKSAKL